MADLPGKAPKARTLPHRFRVSVPVADEAVVAWMELQDNPSLSVRMLIRENIERHGFVDVVNRPVAQLPKRGRPSGGSDGEPALSGPGTNEAAAAAARFPPVPAIGPGADAIGVAAQFPPMPADVLDLSSQEPETPELLGIALEAPTLKRDQHQASIPVAAVPEPDPEPDPAPVQGGQLDVADIFSALRR